MSGPRRDRFEMSQDVLADCSLKHGLARPPMGFHRFIRRPGSRVASPSDCDRKAYRRRKQTTQSDAPPPSRLRGDELRERGDRDDALDKLSCRLVASEKSIGKFLRDKSRSRACRRRNAFSQYGGKKIDIVPRARECKSRQSAVRSRAVACSLAFSPCAASLAIIGS